MLTARLFPLLIIFLFLAPVLRAAETDFFAKQVAPILSGRCLSCHNETEAEGELSFSTAESLFAGGESGQVIEKGDPDNSLLIHYVSGDEPEMPRDADPLSAAEIATLRKWIEQGARWPAGLELRPPEVSDTDWWSLQPLRRPAVPRIPEPLAALARNPLDHFVLAALLERDLAPSPPANRRTLIRRLYFDVIGLPPTPAEVQQFVNDPDPLAYERLVDRLLASPHHGERWARHWLDVVHYGDTHGYDKDKLRPNAYPYRDYVIRSFNADKPYARFVQEQVAGDVLWPGTRDGIEATGFIAAGPWDFIGHAEVPEEKLDGQVARNLDRDDMVSSTMNTFVSTTVQCARCHNHKFDPVTQEHYYSLQAIFAALDRAEREYDADPRMATRRMDLMRRHDSLTQQRESLEKRIRELAGDELAHIDQRLTELSQHAKTDPRPEFGYHSNIEAAQDTEKWVQVDLGETKALTQIIIVGCHDDFNGIGAGFGFPQRFKIEVSDDPEFASASYLVADQTASNYANPGVTPQTFSADGAAGRFVRVTATKLAVRSHDYIFALAELIALDTDGKNAAAGAKVSALDSIEQPPRWQRSNLVDLYYHRVRASGEVLAELTRLGDARKALLDTVISDDMRSERERIAAALAAAKDEVAALPPKQKAYVGTVHHGSGAFKGRGHAGGKPRDVFVLVRGDIQKRDKPVGPGVVPTIPGVDWRFDLPPDHAEGERRVALAKWLTRHDNPLTWRSIVNRVWQHHFGRGIVNTPNDFGRMGALPTHPELLEWLAVEFRDSGQSLKKLHRLILTSHTYRQSSESHAGYAAIDGDNRYLWRMNRRALEAESIRDAVLAVSGKLDKRMYGPAFRDFVLERPEHSPHYEYHKHDPDDPASHRRAVYRFLVRSQQQPFMQTLDCADPSQSIARRDTTLTAIQALTLLNNKFMVRMAEHFAVALSQRHDDATAQVRTAYQQVTGRLPSPDELRDLVAYTHQFGLANTCRVLLNLNEFVFVD